MTSYRLLRSVICSTISAAVFLVPIRIPAQQTAKPPEQDDVVRVNTNLVQLRAVVTDRSGKVIDNLTKDDFEVQENGHPQGVSFFSLERIAGSGNTPGGRGSSSPGKLSDSNLAKTPPDRSVVLFVDTLHLSIASLILAKKQLRRFVDEQMTDHDVVEVVTTSGELGVLQQFTRDRGILRNAINKISGFLRPSTLFTPYLAAQVLQQDTPPPPMSTSSGGRRSPTPPAPTPVGMDALAVATQILAGEGDPTDPRFRAQEILGQETIMRRSTLDILKGIVDQVSGLPGQRMIMFLSEGFTLLDSNGGAEHDTFTSTTSEAVRSGVVIYAFSPEGLSVPDEFTAASPVSFNATTPTLGATFGSFMSASRMDQQGTLRNLASDTGGDAFLNSNDVAGEFKKSLDANSIYYAIAYYPQDESARKFRSIKLRVKDHPDYRIRTEKGYQPSESRKAEIASTPEEKLLQAMLAPLPSSGIAVNSVARFLPRADDQAQVTLQVHFDGNQLQYKQENEKNSLNCEVAIAVLDRTGKLVKSFAEPMKANLSRDEMKNASEMGYRYNKRLIMGTGLHQIRVGVRDLNGGLMGTSVAWINIPDLANKKLALSSLFLSKEKESSRISTGVKKGASASSLALGMTAFKKGETALYRIALYNLLSEVQSTNLLIKVEILQSGDSLYDGEWQPIASRIVGKESNALEIGGRLRIGLDAGIYTMRISIRDEKSKRTIDQSIDFETE